VSNSQYGLPIQQLKDLEADHVLARTVGAAIAGGLARA
jgi:hypothetical protein